MGCVLNLSLRALATLLASWLDAGLNYPVPCGAMGQMGRSLGAWTAGSRGGGWGGALGGACVERRVHMPGVISSPAEISALSVFFFFFSFSFSFFFLRLHLQHIEVPRLGVKSEL